MCGCANGARADFVGGGCAGGCAGGAPRLARAERTLIPKFGPTATKVIEYYEPTEAIMIGPESDHDSCYVSKQGKAGREKYLVSKDRPFIGYLEGPFLVEPYKVIGTTITAALDLLFYPKAPDVLPTKRSPRRDQAQFTFSGAGETTVFNIPCIGRAQIELSLFNNHASSLTWKLMGAIYYNVAGVVAEIAEQIYPASGTSSLAGGGVTCENYVVSDFGYDFIYLLATHAAGAGGTICYSVETKD